MINKIFNDKVCWITGASGGIGAALAATLNQLGARLILSSRDPEHLEQVKDCCSQPERITILPCDMEQTPALPDIALQAWEIFDGIDYVFLNAGIAVRDTVINTQMDLVQKVMNVNFFSNVAISKALLPMMIKRGSGCFVVTSSICGKFGVPKLSAYAASKHALHGFYESLRVEYENAGIRVTIVTSGLVKTNITVNALTGNGNRYGKMQESVANGIAPEKCARGILQAVAHEKREALIGGIDKYGVLIKRFFPGLFAWGIRKHPLKKIRVLRALFGHASPLPGQYVHN